MASNIGRTPIIIPEELTLEVITKETHKELIFINKDQKWSISVPNYFNFNIDNSNRTLLINPQFSPESLDKNSKQIPAFWGALRKLIANISIGLTQGYTYRLGVRGVGYKFELVTENTFLIYLGFTQPLRVNLPKTIECKLLKNNTILEGKCNNLELITNEFNKIRLLKAASKDKYKNKGLYIVT